MRVHERYRPTTTSSRPGWNWALTTSETFTIRLATNTMDFAGCPTPQRIATYTLSSNRQRPFAGAFHAAVFNTFRRFRSQVLYVAPPFIIAYAAMNWATER